MLGKIKWIMSVFLIVVIIITIILFVNYKNNSNNNIVDESEIKNIYNKKWYKVNVQVYNEGKLSTMIDNYADGYILFSDDRINYCTNNDCEEYNYNYNNDVIEIPIDKFIYHGKYNIVFDDNNLDFIQENGSNKVIYHFETPKG